MANTQNPNLEILELVIHQLGELADELVFVGGCATGLLLTDPAAAPVRATYDVDAIAQVLSRAEYYQFAEKLKGKGFREDAEEGAPMCRWRCENVILDGRPELLGELERAGSQIKQELASRFEALRQNTSFIDAVAGHLAPDAASQARLRLLASYHDWDSKLRATWGTGKAMLDPFLNPAD